MRWACVLFLLLSAMREVDGAIISNYSAYSGPITAACASAPVWKLNLCNLTCATCVASSPNLCDSCDSDFLYENNYCHTSNISNFYYFTNLLATPIITISDAKQLQRGMTGASLTYSDTVAICTSNTYAFQMLGMFASSDEIILPLAYTETMQEFTLKFNLLLLVNQSKLTVTFKSSSGVEKISKNYDVADATAFYAPSSMDGEYNLLNLPSLTMDNARTFIQPVTMNVQFYNSEVDISFVVVSPNAKGSDQHWGISDISVLATQCNTCVTTAVASTINFVGMLTLYVLAGTVVFLALLWFCMCIIRWRKERAAMAMANSGKDYLPVKPIDRVIATIGRKGKAEEGNIQKTWIKSRSRKDLLKSL